MKSSRKINAACDLSVDPTKADDFFFSIELT